MTGVAPYGNLMRVNGPGRDLLAQAVDGHRNNRSWSRQAMSERAKELGAEISPGTIKNVERSQRDVKDRTLVGLDAVFEWEPGTARSILVEKAAVPSMPSRLARMTMTIPRKLQAELDGREVYDTRAIDISQGDTKIIISVVGAPDMTLTDIRAALLALDELERKFRGDQ